MTNKHSIAAAAGWARAGWARTTRTARTARSRAGSRLQQRDRDRGDVPGWVLITIMTAGLVTVLWALAGAQLTQLFTQAMSTVTGPR